MHTCCGSRTTLQSASTTQADGKQNLKHWQKTATRHLAASLVALNYRSQHMLAAPICHAPPCPKCPQSKHPHAHAASSRATAEHALVASDNQSQHVLCCLLNACTTFGRLSAVKPPCTNSYTPAAADTCPSCFSPRNPARALLPP
jgi:hypothetical protein